MTHTLPKVKLTSLPTDLNSRYKAVSDYAKILLKQYGLDNWHFTYNNRRRSAGVCNYGKCSIELSTHLIQGNDIPEIVDTLLHEIAHALTPKQHHGPAWVRMAQQIGCNGKRCFSSDEKTMPKGKYKYACPNSECGRIIHTHKRIKLGRKACGVCCKKHSNGKFDAKYAFVFAGTHTVSVPVKVQKTVTTNNTVFSESEAIRMFKSGKKSVGEIAKELGVKYSKIYFLVK